MKKPIISSVVPITYAQAFDLVRTSLLLSYRKAATLMADIKRGTASPIAINADQLLTVGWDGKWVLA